MTEQLDDRLLLGASWYPEMWPDSEWPADLAKMRAIGFNIVRLFEFAWSRFEPEEGKFDFVWARRVMDLCHEAGTAVMIGTPTAAPPAWLTYGYPEVLRTGPDGRRENHGKRKHYNPHSRRYQDFCGRIAERMAQELGDHPALHSWQIDNEMSGYDYGSETARHFHAWLEDRYGSIDNLNTTWGLDFWSQKYDSFEQIPLCTAQVGSTEVPERNHPSLIIAIARFQNQGWHDFIRIQCEAIRRSSGKPITSNMTDSPAIEWYWHNRLLDRVGASLYKDLPHYKWNIRSFDRMRAEKPQPFWFLETAPNWSGGGKMWNIHQEARGVEAISWMSVFLGGSMLLYWQWRSHWAGQEMNHGTCVSATGRWRPNKEAWARLAANWKRHGDWLLAHPPASGDVALVESNAAAWAFSIDPLDVKMEYRENFRDRFHLPLVESHIWRDIIDPDRDFSKYRVLLLPLMPIVPRELRDRLRAWVEGGGQLILGPLTGYRTDEFTAWKDKEFGGLEEIMGGTSSIGFPAIAIEDQIEVTFADGQMTRTRAWCEGFAPDSAEVLASYHGGYGGGHAAILRNRIGAGSVTSVGCLLDRPTYLRLVREAMGFAGSGPVATGSPDVIVVPRADRDGVVRGYAVLNYTLSPQSITLASGGTDLLTGEKVPAQLDLEPLQPRLIAL